MRNSAVKDSVILGLLKKERRKVRSLFQALESKRTSRKDRKDAWYELRRELTRQILFEETVVLPRIMGNPHYRLLILRTTARHGTVDRTLNLLEMMTYGTERWNETLQSLRGLLKEQLYATREMLYQVVETELGDQHKAYIVRAMKKEQQVA